jgi:hypothetical protein
LYAFIFSLSLSLMRVTCPAHTILCEFRHVVQLWKSLLWKFLQLRQRITPSRMPFLTFRNVRFLLRWTVGPSPNWQARGITHCRPSCFAHTVYSYVYVFSLSWPAAPPYHGDKGFTAPFN